jgi:hypothetical protein
MNRFNSSLVTALSVLLLASSASAAPTGVPSAPTWTWPLYEAGTNSVSTPGIPRPAVWTTHGEYQEFSGPGNVLRQDLHPGIDIRGQNGDRVLFPASGTVVYVSNPEHCSLANSTETPYCRVWGRADAPNDQVLYYVGHMDFMGDDAASPVNSALREKLLIAQDGTVLTMPGPPASSVHVNQGEFVGTLSRFFNATGWDHLHLGVYDVGDDFASLDPLPFLQRDVPGATFAIKDDERPSIKTFEIKPDVGKVAGSYVKDASGGSICGTEVHGALDLLADIEDTFFSNRPTPAPFDLFTDPPTTGIKGARFVVNRIGSASGGIDQQWYKSPLACRSPEENNGLPLCGLWRLPFMQSREVTFRNSDGSPSYAGFFAYLEAGTARGAPYWIGGDFDAALYEFDRSDNDHLPTGGANLPAIHLLSNGVTEADASPKDGAWITGESGRYVVTLEAWDDAGNRNSSSQVVTVNNAGLTAPGTGSGWRNAYLQDSPSDFGQIPSTLGGEPFWASPDIVVVPEGTSVTPTYPASAAPFVVNKPYDVYLRVHNNGCDAVSNVRGRVFYATPGTTFTDVHCISEAGETAAHCAGNYSSLTTNVAGLGVALLGPFKWTPTQADLDGAASGHRCFLAAIDVSDDAGPSLASVASWDVRQLDNVAQRNVQVSELSFAIQNPEPSNLNSRLLIDVGSFPVGTSGASLVLKLGQTAELDPLLASYPKVNGAYQIDLRTGMLTLPPSGSWTMPAVSEVPATIDYSLPEGSGPHTVKITHELGGKVVGGMVFILSGPDIVK